MRNSLYHRQFTLENQPQAGLLAYGSTRLASLPIEVSLDSDREPLSQPVPIYSGGTATDLHRVPRCLQT